MFNDARATKRPNGVIGPTGKPLTVDSLPPAGTKRWVIRRKAEVVAAVQTVHRKQRHTAKRIFERLRDEHRSEPLAASARQHCGGSSP